jgi:hypothetical protein
MANSVTVSCKVDPAHYTVLQALAAGDNKPLSQFIRDTLVQALDLEHHTERLAELIASAEPSP